MADIVLEREAVFVEVQLETEEIKKLLRGKELILQGDDYCIVKLVNKNLYTDKDDED